jgi:hypothetical protein
MSDSRSGRLSIHCICSGKFSSLRDPFARLEEARGNYKIVARLFNMDKGDYKRFLHFLRKHDCQLPYKEYR